MNGIYGYLDLKTNEIVYIGKDSHIDNDKRHKAHLSKSRYNDQPINRILQNNPKRYKYARIIVGDFDNIMLNGLEIQYIEACNPKFNFTLGGDGMVGYVPSKETREKLSKANKGKKRPELSKRMIGENNHFYGKTHSLESREKMSKARKGKTFSQEHKDKLSKSLKGKMAGENHFMFGKTHSKETKERMSKARNTSGLFRVSKLKDEKCKQKFRWRYDYQENGKHKAISSVDLSKLKSKVLAKNLPWKIIDEEKARESIQWQIYN